MQIERALGTVRIKTQKNIEGIAESYEISLPPFLEEDESLFVCLVHINSHFFILWETVYSLSIFSFALLTPYYVATRNLHFMTDF